MIPLMAKNYKFYPASIPDTNAPIEICIKINIKKEKGIIENNFN